MKQANGVILYRGPSMLDGSPIVAIATGTKRPSTNRKTGDMIQVWILPETLSPLDALASGADVAVCGSCPLRGILGKARACYVDIGKAPGAVWRAFHAGAYPDWDGADFTRPVRLGAWGDPAALPIEALERIVGAAPLGHTGYTHAWRTLTGRTGARYRALVMASADTPLDGRTARARGWRTFAVTPKGERISSGSRPREIVCPATVPGSTKTCAECLACNGSSGRKDKRASITVEAHGAGASYVGVDS